MCLLASLCLLPNGVALGFRLFTERDRCGPWSLIGLSVGSGLVTRADFTDSPGISTIPGRSRGIRVSLSHSECRKPGIRQGASASDHRCAPSCSPSTQFRRLESHECVGTAIADVWTVADATAGSEQRTPVPIVTRWTGRVKCRFFSGLLRAVCLLFVCWLCVVGCVLVGWCCCCFCCCVVLLCGVGVMWCGVGVGVGVVVGRSVVVGWFCMHLLVTPLRIRLKAVFASA